MALHYITGDPVKINGVIQKSVEIPGEILEDTSIEGLAKLYGVGQSAIASANGFKLTKSSIYTYLSTHGGTRQAKDADPKNTTGYHWSFSVYNVVEIPVDQSKIVSPVPMDKKDEVKPVGPATPPVTGTTPSQAAVGMDSMTMILIAGAAIGLLLMMKTGGKKGRKTSKRRKTARRTTRRRR